MLGKTDQPTEIWDCDPLLVVHGTDGVVFSMKTKAEFVPTDRTGRAGRIHSLTPSSEGWTPTLNFTQRVEMLQTFDVRYERRRGLILLGNDDEGEPFTWYLNGEADRYLMSSDVGAERMPELALTESLAERALGTKEHLRLLFVERADGHCPFNGRTDILRVPYQAEEVLEYVESMSLGEDGRLPSIYVVDSVAQGDGWVLTGYDADDFAVTWYINEAAESL